MNDAHIHLLINHIPIIGLIIGVLILLFGIIFKSSLTKKIALAVVLCCVFLAIPSFSTGEEAEEVIEHMSSMTKETHHLIHEHEEKAELFMPFAWILIVLSLVTLIFEWKKKKFASYLSILTLVVGLVAIYIVREVGTTGGEISHPEIRKGFVPTEEEHED
jgi:cobalamin synthase